ncbi:MAG: tetratricopeptide repeat protein [Mariprofundaceae bacterium]
MKIKLRIIAMYLLSFMAMGYHSIPAGAASTDFLSVASDLIESGKKAFLKGEFEEALELLLQAAEKDSQNSEIKYQTALVYQGLLDYQTAKKYFEQAVKLDETHAQAWAHWGEILYRDKEYRLSEHALLKALKLSKTAYSHYMIGLVLMEQKDYSQALHHLKESYELHLSYKQKAMYSIGLVHMENDHEKLAKKAFIEAVSIAPSTFIGVISDMALKVLSQPEPRKWHVNVNYAVSYDDNIILKPDENNPQLQGITQGDFVHALSLYGTYQMMRKGKFQINANAFLYRSMHQTITYMDADMFSAWLAPAYSTPVGVFSVDLRGDTSWVNGVRYGEGYGIFPRLNFNITKSQSGYLQAGYQKQRFIASVQGAENRDSNHYSASYSHSIRFANQASLSANYGYNAAISKGTNWTSRGHSVSGAVNYPLIQKLFLQMGGNYSVSKYRNTHSTAQVKRSSKGIGFSASLSYQIEPVTLQLQYAHSRSKDNISVYQYRRNSMGLSLNYSH